MKAECTINGALIRRVERDGRDELSAEGYPSHPINEHSMGYVLLRTGLFTEFEISSVIGMQTRAKELVNAIREAAKERSV